MALARLPPQCLHRRACHRPVAPGRETAIVHRVQLQLVASGSLGDFAPPVVATIFAALAAQAGLAERAVRVEVTAGSVLLTATLDADTEAVAVAARALLEPVVTTAADASTFLSQAAGFALAVEATPRIT